MTISLQYKDRKKINMEKKNIEKSDFNVVKHIKQKKRSTFIKIGNNFMKDFLFDENENAIDIQITSLRIIFLIYNTFSSSNDANLFLFQPSREPRQLKLFEDEFETENNQYVRLSLKISDIIQDQNRKHLETALEFLTDFKKQWYESVNSQGKKIRSYGGLIYMPTYEEKGYSSFLISSYWLKKILMIDTYELFLLETAFKISSSKDILFLLWLARVNKEKGTTISLDLLNKRFDLNYKTTKDISSKFLNPLKKKFDEHSRLSFGHSRKGKNLSIMPYPNTLKVDDQEASEKIETIYKLHYLKKRHCLEGEYFEKLKLVYNQENVDNKKEISLAYDLLKKQCRTGENKISITSYQEEDFIKKLQECIILNYNLKEVSKSLPNGYVRII